MQHENAAVRKGLNWLLMYVLFVLSCFIVAELFPAYSFLILKIWYSATLFIYIILNVLVLNFMCLFSKISNLRTANGC